MSTGENHVSRTVKVINPLGMHLRPADMFTKLAQRFASRVEVVKDGQKVNGKSVMEMLMLAATQGSELAIFAAGPDAAAAVEALAELFAQGFSEMDSDDAPEKRA